MEIIINNTEFSLPDVIVPLTFQINDGDNIITGSASKSITVPASPEIQAIFDYLEDVKSTGVTQNNKPTAVVLDEGVEVMRGFAKVTKVKVGLGNSYTLNIISDNRDWANAMKQRTLRDNDWSDGNHSLTRGNVYASEVFSLNGVQTPLNIIDWITYPLINYGAVRGVDSAIPFVKLVSQRDRFPAIKINEIIYRLFKQQGYKISSTFYTNILSKYYLPCTEFWHPLNYREDKLFRAKLTGDQTVTTIDTPILIGFDTEDFDNGSGFNISTSKYTVPESMNMGFKGTIKMTIPVDPTEIVTLRLYSYNPVTFAETLLAYIDTAETGTVALDIEVPTDTYVIDDRQIYIKVQTHITGLIVHKESSFSNNPSLEYVNGQTAEVNSFIQDINELSFIQAIKGLFNLRFWTDTKERTVYFEPEEDFYNGSEIDISLRVDYSKNIQESFFTPAKLVEFQYANDSNDKFLDEYNKRLVNPLGYGSETMLNQFGAEKTTSINMFSPTYMGNMEQAGLYQTQVPRMWQKEDLPELSTDFNVRILYYNGRQTCKNAESWISQNSVQFPLSGTVTRTDYPQFYFYDLDEVNQNSLLFKDEAGGRGLITRYQKYKLNRLNNSRIVEMNLKIDSVFINTFSFRDSYKIESTEKPEISGFYHLLKISDYKGNGSYKCTFMQIPASDPIIDTAIDTTGAMTPITERSLGDGFSGDSRGTSLKSGGVEIARYDNCLGFLSGGVPVLMEVGADSQLKEMFIEVNGQEVKMTI